MVSYSVNIDPQCFVDGTWIATEFGDVPVEQLRPGVRVKLADGRLAPVRWLGRSRVVWRQTDTLRTLPVRVSAGRWAADCRRAICWSRRAMRCSSTAC